MIETALVNMGGLGIALAVMWDNNKRFAKALDHNTEALNSIARRIETCPKK